MSKEIAKTVATNDQESRRDRFVRVAENRVNKIIAMIKLLGNCSGSAYEYDMSDVHKIFNAIENEVDAAKSRFKDRKGDKKKVFSLS